MTINREMLTAAMQNIDTCCEAINAIISPDKKIQQHKGARLGKIRKTSEGYWSDIILPQWVKLEGTTDKNYQFRCTESGVFLEWVGGIF